MKKDFGQKLKDISESLFFLGLLLTIVPAIVLIVLDKGLLLTVIIVAPLIILFLRISTYLMYGFGQLIENTDIIASHYQEQQPKNTRNMEITSLISNEAIDEDTVVNFVCPACDKKISCTKKQIKNKEIHSCPACNTPILFKQQ